MLKIPARFKQCDLSVSLAFDYCDCIVNMGTRSAAFTVKIRSLYDYHLRLMHGAMPLPSGVDIANTIKYFSQTLLTILKDVPNSPLELLKNPEMDSVRMGLFPNLDYKGLYNSLIPLIEVAPLMQYGIHAFGEAVLQCLGCLLPFLEHDFIDNLPYFTASSIAVLPSSLHQDIVNSLCFYILPFTITRLNDREHEMSQSVSAVIMMIFQYSSNTAHHCQLLECLMILKRSILKDILSVIAYGTSTARSSAAKLLFYYWPAFNPNLFDRKGLICKLGGDSAPFVCQRDMCPNAGNTEAAKVCYNHCISITYACDKPPPLYLCIECANDIHREHPNQQFFDILHPMQQVSMVCENKNCRSTDRSAVSMCFSQECVSYNGNRPIRYCHQCHNNRHNTRRGGDHIYHKSIPPTWSMDKEMQTYMVEAIISLLKESKVPSQESKESSDGKQSTAASTNLVPQDNISAEERQLLGRYGVWLLVGRCTPDETTPKEVMGRILAMLFHWFHMTAYSYDGQEESTLEKLKTENVCGWLKDLSKTHYKLFISCLLPHPPDYARIGGHWDTLASRTSHLKDGLNRLFCLIPYEIITQDIWNFIMPHWMEAISNDVPEKELPELRIILNKILDIDMSPLGFSASEMYHFVGDRFERATARVQEQALRWLQRLTMLELVIPLSLLFSIFGEGVYVMKTGVETQDPEKQHLLKEKMDINELILKKTLISPIVDDCDSGNTSLSDEEGRLSQHAEFESDTEHNLLCCILMLDILLKQMEMQNIDEHTGLNSQLCKDVCKLLKCMVTATWIGNHTCTYSTRSECIYCESSIMWHQLCLQLVRYLSPEHPAHPPDLPLEDASEDGHSRKSPPEIDKKEAKSDMVMSIPLPEIHSVGGVLVHMPHIMTATVETVSEQLDLAAIIPSEKVVSAVARAITLSDSDVATATAVAGKPQVISENDEPIEPGPDDDINNFWHTSMGKFKFTVEDLPEQLQYIYELLMEIPKVEKPDILYYMLQCLKILCLHGDACTKASKEQRGFFIWCQENLLIKNLWNLCNSEHSHISQQAVPLLLHCITLPVGSDVFWRVIQEEFHNNDWRVRFVAVERVTIIARFMDSTPLRNVPSLQAALANAFCYLISSMDDSNVYVAQRSTLYLGTIHDSAIKSLIMCLETQFDSVIVDRPMVLQSLYQLHNSISERRILSWDFFLNRFDTLFLEAQIGLEKAGDFPYVRDLRNSDINSEVFIRKVHRAQEALSQTDGSAGSSIKTLSASFGTKWPYKRTMSAPASIVPRHEIKESKEKVYNRQYSAPILKRKSSRFGLDGHMHSFNVTDDQNLTGYMHRIIDLEEADKETMHLLIFLLMQFLSRSDQAYPTDEKSLTKSQGIVLRHLFVLLGYNQNERGLYIPPQRLRYSAAFSAYLSNLPQLLDQNHLMGRMLLPTSLILLQYVPSPSYFANSLDFQQPTYSLWALEPHCRRSWLMALVVLLYKYQYSQQPLATQLNSLIKIVINTLDSQHHHCRRIPATVIMGAPSTRSRDVSQPSLGTDNEHDRLVTPPLSPMYSLDGQSIHVSVGSKIGKVVYAKPSSTTSMETHWEETQQPDKKSLKKGVDCELEDSESELLAIPESDQSDSTLQGSAQDSFEEAMEDSCYSSAASKVCGSTSKTYDRDYLARSDYLTREFTERKPKWFIGSEGDSLKNIENAKRCDFSERALSDLPNSVTHHRWLSSADNSKNCSTKIGSLGTVGLAGTLSVAAGVASTRTTLAKTMTTDSHRQVTSSTTTDAQHGSQKRPNLRANSSSTSDCEECLKNIQDYPILSVPSLERLLPIGSAKAIPFKASSQVFCEELSLRSPDSPLSKMDLMVLDSPRDSVFLPAIESQLEVPRQERLLPIGQQPKDISQLIDKVKVALGIESEYQKQTDNHKKGGFFEDRGEIPQIHSSRRLIKQVALESPPNHTDFDSAAICKDINSDNRKDTIIDQRQKGRKTGIFSISAHNLTNPKKLGSWHSPQLSPRLEGFEIKQSLFRTGEESISERCSECGMVKEEYSDEEIGLCIVTLGTFIHREPALAAPLLPEILTIVAKVTTNAMYPWQNESNIHLPGGAVSVAHQFLRCVLHQLAPNGIFTQMFQTHVSDTARMHFFKSVTQALTDFNELNPVAPLQYLLETLNSKKHLPTDSMPIILQNMACYFECLPLEAGLTSASSTSWGTVLLQLENLYRRILFFLHNLEEIAPLLKIMVCVLKIPTISQFKGLLEPFSKVISCAIESHVLKYNYLVDACYLCNRVFSKERDKLVLSRMVVFELIQALKFKISIPDSNFLILISLILHDAGGSIPVNVVIKDALPSLHEVGPVFNTYIADCMRVHLGDIVEFLTDFHSLTKLKSYCKGISVGLNEDTIGGIIKGAIAQYLALEITKGNGRDNRAVTRYFPWLYSASTNQQTSREFIECISHIRLLSWLLLGSLTHSALHGVGSNNNICQPIPQEASCQIADHIQVIMAGFSDQPKTSVLHMSSLFHTFILCQLWTVYLEQGLNNYLPVSEPYNVTMNILFDFWGKITPSILHLVQQSKLLSEIVSFHFLNMLEALLECHSTLVGKLLPLWTPVLCSNHLQLPGHLQVRLQTCRNFPPNTHIEVLPNRTKFVLNNPILLKWLQRLQFRMGQIELQSSAVIHFYSL